MENTQDKEISQSSLEEIPVEVFRKDYKPCSYIIQTVSLEFDLSISETIVKTTMDMWLSPFEMETTIYPDLVLDGEGLELLSISINGTSLIQSNDYDISKLLLTIKGSAIPSKKFQLITVVKISPEKNHALVGLYKSGTSSLLCTQCEAMGFRRITYYLDRPDILAKYKVRLEGDKSMFPVLLSNGNCIDSGDLENGRHWALWEDPFPKPSYLFALVAGDLASISSEYVTMSDRKVKLGIYSDKENVSKLDHAMYSLKKAMKWDEDTFGLECDLDLFNVVAVSDFNSGAMENKGLNIFNAAFVLANPKTSTDNNYVDILGVIGHEYFHNWTGNRVTVRDWFQLTLKEGLTVFRDQWFTADETGYAVKRIEDISGLRSTQFAEDQGPMAHPIRPDSYISMDNFYTSTVYEKGAEIIRIYRTLLGIDGFKAGMKEYFKRHDGSAVTCDDFRNAMADANGVDLSQLELWYSQAGTPIVSVSESYDKNTKQYRINLSQRIPSTPGQPEESKKPMLIPVTLGLLSRSSGKEILSSTVLKLTESKQEFIFDNISEDPVASILRDFSAPVKLEFDQSDSDLALLMAYDTDSFNRWEAGNRLSTKVIYDIEKAIAKGDQLNQLPNHYIDAVHNLLKIPLEPGCTMDLSLIAYALQLPDIETLSQNMEVIHIDSLHAARKFVKKCLADVIREDFLLIYDFTEAKTMTYEFSAREVGRRRLHNTCLDYLSCLDEDASIKRAMIQFKNASCMTDKIGAFSILCSKLGSSEREEAIQQFYDDAAGDALVLNKWFSIQASTDTEDAINHVIALKSHPDFTLSNPNRARSVLGSFAHNLVHFHSIDGRGYQFLTDSIIEIDKINPQIAAFLCTNFNPWKRFDVQRQVLMKNQLERIKSCHGISKDTLEIVIIALSN